MFYCLRTAHLMLGNSCLNIIGTASMQSLGPSGCCQASECSITAIAKGSLVNSRPICLELISICKMPPAIPCLYMFMHMGRSHESLLARQVSAGSSETHVAGCSGTSRTSSSHQASSDLLEDPLEACQALLLQVSPGIISGRPRTCHQRSSSRP